MKIDDKLEEDEEKDYYAEEDIEGAEDIADDSDDDE